MRRLKAIRLLPALLTVAVLTVNAEVTDSLTRALDEVIVSASRMEREAVPVQTLEGEALAHMTAYSVADALRLFGGVQVKDYGGVGGLKTVNVRSLGSQHVGVFVDGIAVDNAQNGVVDLGRFSLEDMESVSLYNGQKSAVLQSARDYASSSAVYLQTRRPREKGLKVGLKTGTILTVNPSLRWEQRIDSTLSLSVSGEWLKTDGRYPFRVSRDEGYDTLMIRENGDVESLRLEAALFGDHDERGEHWMLKGYFYGSDRGYPGAAVRSAPGMFTHEDRQSDLDTYLQGQWRCNVLPWWSLQAQGKLAWDQLHYLSDPKQSGTTMYVDRTYLQREAYGSLAHLLALTPWWSVSLATDVQVNGVTADMPDFAQPSRRMLSGAASTLLTGETFNVQGSLLYTDVYDRVRAENAGEGTAYRCWTPAVTLSWTPASVESLTLRSFVKRSFRMPTLNDLYYTVIGNRRLQPEVAMQYDLGGTWTLPSEALHLEFQGDLYHNSVENKIVATPSGNQFCWTMTNMGRVLIDGADVSLRSAWDSDGFRGFQRASKGSRSQKASAKVRQTLTMTYTWQRARNVTDPRSPWYGGQIPYTPRHSGSATYGGRVGAWSWNASMVMTGTRYESVANIADYRLPPWMTLDMNVARTLQAGNTEGRLTLEMDNVTNTWYEVVKCYPMPGRNLRLRLEWWW